MELIFLTFLVVVLAVALGSGFPVAFAIPGAAVLTIGVAAFSGYLVFGNTAAFFAHGGPSEWLWAGVLNFRSIYRSDDGDTLIAIPLFIFMGYMLQHSRIAEDLLDAMAKLLGIIRGGLGISVVLVGALLAATTSVIGATVVTVGTISLPALLRAGYPKSLATGLTAATGTLGQIVPPSIVLVILAHQLSTAVSKASGQRRAAYKEITGSLSMPTELDVTSLSVSDMFIGALVPGLVLVGLYVLYVGIAAARLKPAADLQLEAQGGNAAQAARTLVALLPPLALILLVLGSIISGVATINQAAAIGAAGATIMAGSRLMQNSRGAFSPAIVAIVAVGSLGAIMANWDLNLRKIGAGASGMGISLAVLASLALAFAIFWSGWRTLRINRTLSRVLDETLKTTALVFAILLGAVMLTAAFRAFGGEDLVRQALQSLPGGFWGQFTVAMMIIFFLGFFLDFIEITVLVVPIVVPILLTDPTANVAAVWLGVMIAINIQTSFLTPPFGFALFYLRGVVPPGVRTLDIYKGVMPFIALQLVALVLVGAMPSLANYLPARRMMLSEMAPTLTNPRLQYCVESYVADAFEERDGEIRRAISQVQTLDLSLLPEPLRGQLADSFAGAERTIGQMAEVTAAQEAVSRAAVPYLPILGKVRLVQQEIRRIDQEIERLDDAENSNFEPASTAASGGTTEAALRKLTEARSALVDEIPPNWEMTEREFREIQQDEDKARRAFRTDARKAYGDLTSAIALLEGTALVESALQDIETTLQSLGTIPQSNSVERIKAINRLLVKIHGSKAVLGDLKSGLTALRAGPTDLTETASFLSRAQQELRQEYAWRALAADSLLSGLRDFEAVISDTVGLRGQSSIPRPVALYLAKCTATPRNLSLYF